MKYNRLTAALLITSLTAVSLVGCGEEAENISDSQSAVTQDAIDEMDSMMNEFEATNLIKHSSESGKEETVYVIMDANGANQETIVSEWLKNPNGIQTLTDISTLNDIEVVKGNASYIAGADNSLTWEAGGSDVYYQGTTNKELPVSVSVSYSLDGVNVDATSLTDITGHLKIDYNYDNKIYKMVQIGDENCKIYQPFTTITGLLFDETTASNIQVSDGKVVNSGDFTIVFGVAMPGLKESLGLDDIDDDKDINIPESISIEADVVDFTMPMSMTVVSNNALSELKLDDIDSIDDLKDKVAELEDGMNQLLDGTDELNDGMLELADGTTELSDGVAELDDGATELNDGAHELADGTVELQDGAFQLYDGTFSLKDGTKKLDEGLSTLNGKTPELASGVNQLNDGAKALNAGAAELATKGEALKAGAGQVADGVKMLSDNLLVPNEEDPSKNSEFYNGLLTVKGAGTTIKVGAGDLKAGATQIKNGPETLYGNEEYKNLKGALLGDTLGLTDMQKGYVQKLIETYDGVLSNLSVGAEKLEGGAAQLEDAGGQIETAAGEKLIPGYKQLAEGAATLNGGASQLKDGVNAYTAGATELGKGAAQLSAGTSKLNESVPALVDGVAQLADGAGQLNNGARSLNDGAGKLYDGTGELVDGAHKLADGTNELKDGTTELKDGVAELTDGVSQLVDGTGKLKDGVIEFNEEGISKIVDLVNNDLESYYDRLCAVRDFAKEYTSFTSNDKNEDNTVKFIYKMNPVEKVIESKDL